MGMMAEMNVPPDAALVETARVVESASRNMTRTSRTTARGTLVPRWGSHRGDDRVENRTTIEEEEEVDAAAADAANVNEMTANGLETKTETTRTTDIV